MHKSRAWLGCETGRMNLQLSGTLLLQFVSLTSVWSGKPPSHRRKPVSSALKILDSGFRRNDKPGLVQYFLSYRNLRSASGILR